MVENLTGFSFSLPDELQAPVSSFGQKRQVMSEVVPGLQDHGVIADFGSQLRDHMVRNQRRNEIYYRGQARAMGLSEPVDPSKANGHKLYASPLPQAGTYSFLLEDVSGIVSPQGNKYWDERRDWDKYKQTLPNALASSEKHELAGVPFN